MDPTPPPVPPAWLHCIPRCQLRRPAPPPPGTPGPPGPGTDGAPPTRVGLQPHPGSPLPLQNPRGASAQHGNTDADTCITFTPHLLLEIKAEGRFAVKHSTVSTRTGEYVEWGGGRGSSLRLSCRGRGGRQGQRASGGAAGSRAAGRGSGHPAELQGAGRPVGAAGLRRSCREQGGR